MGSNHPKKPSLHSCVADSFIKFDIKRLTPDSLLDEEGQSLAPFCVLILQVLFFYYIFTNEYY